jgi:hypothetical protein
MHFSRSWPISVSQRPLLVPLVAPLDAELAGAVVVVLDAPALSVLVPLVAEPEVPAS